MPLLRNGTKFLAILGLLFSIDSCRTSVPPAIDVCIGDGVGGSDCVLKDGSRAYLAPSQMKNYWCTPQADMAAFSAWAYDVSPVEAQTQMNRIQHQALQ